jgi:hypothetical protein
VGEAQSLGHCPDPHRFCVPVSSLLEHSLTDSISTNLFMAFALFVYLKSFPRGRANDMSSHFSLAALGNWPIPDLGFVRDI